MCPLTLILLEGTGLLCLLSEDGHYTANLSTIAKVVPAQPVTIY